MTRYTPELLTALQGYTDDPKDHQIIEFVIAHGGIRKAAELEPVSRRTVQRRLSKLYSHAVKHGLNTQQPDASTIEDLPIFAKSRLIKHDPPLADGSVLSWVKSKEQDYTLAKLIAHMCSGIIVEPATPRPPLADCQVDILPLLVLADSHLGMLASEAETGEDWNLEKALEVIQETVDYLVDKMDPCENAVLVNLGDLVHADGLKPVTPRSGHSLDVSARYFDVARAAGSLMRYIIERLLDKAQNVTVYSVRGNHDEVTSWHIQETLHAVYEMEPRVKVPQNDSPHQMFEWKGNMVVMTHGEAARGKAESMYQYITTKWSEAFGRAKYGYVLQGHVHHSKTQTIGRFLFETFATLIPPDTYHEANLYRSRREMSLVLLEAGGGSSGRINKAPRI